jgi:hypothetical protein
MLLDSASKYNTSLSPERDESEADVLFHRLTGKCKITGHSASFSGGENDDFRLGGYDVYSLREVKKTFLLRYKD